MGILVGLYRAHLSSHIASGCKFQPSCSAYASECLRKHTFGRSLFLITIRFLKCHPLRRYSLDPVPPTSSARGNP